MPEDKRLQIRMRFGEPQDGWLPVDVLLHERSFSESISYTTNDGLLDFVDLLQAMACGQVTKPCIWRFEPEELELTATVRADLVPLEGRRWPDHRRTLGG